MILADEEATAALGARLASIAGPGDVIALSGPLGVGKTALARGFIAALWHVDLYRIEQRSEIEELGLDSAADAVLLVEWPDRAGETAWADALRLSLEFAEDGARRLTAEVPPAWEGRWPPQ